MEIGKPKEKKINKIKQSLIVSHSISQQAYINKLIGSCYGMQENDIEDSEHT